MNENPNENEFTAEDGEIRFDPEKDREKQTEAEVEKVKKPKKAKWYFIIPLVFLALFAFVFIGWRIKPKTLLNVCLLDKTVLTVESNCCCKSISIDKYTSFPLTAERVTVCLARPLES